MLDRTGTPAFHLVISLITAAARAVVRARATDMWLLSSSEEKIHSVPVPCLANYKGGNIVRIQPSKRNSWGLRGEDLLTWSETQRQHLPETPAFRCD